MLKKVHKYAKFNVPECPPAVEVVDDSYAESLTPRRKGRIRRALGALATVGLITYVTASISEAINYQHLPTKVVHYTAGTAEQEAYNKNDICFISSGLGLNLTKAYLDNTRGAFAPYCQTVRVEYGSSVDYKRLASVEKDYIDENTLPYKPVNVYYFGGSMGGIANMGSALELEKMDKDDRINIRAQFLDSTPTSPGDTKGWLENVWINIGSKVDGNDGLGHGGDKLVNFVANMFTIVRNGELSDSDDLVGNSAYVTGQTDTRLYTSQLNAIESFGGIDLGFIRDDKIPTFYFHADNPANDPTVNVELALQDWQHILPQTVDLPIKGGGHANSNRVDYSSQLTQAFRMAGAATTEERQKAQENRIQNRMRHLDSAE